MDRPSVSQGLSDHVAEIPDYEWEELAIEAFENGNTGWAHCLATLKFPHNGLIALHRFTFVFVLENGIWQLIQIHVSNSRSNREKMGVEHQALNALVDVVKQGFSLDQHEGLASVMFTDIVGSSALAAALGDRGWSDIIGQHFAQLREIIEQHEGQFVKSLGDGAMSSFSSAHQALSAARAIQTSLAGRTEEPRLALRIGLHTGDVVQSEDDFFGNVVNIAARITSTAGAGEIWASDATKMMIGTAPGFRFTESREILLRGQTRNS